MKEVVRFKRHRCYGTLVAYIKRSIAPEDLIREDEACGFIKAYNLQPAITTTEPALIHARIIPLMSEFKDWQRILAYVQPLRPEVLQELKVRIRHITRFTNKKLAGIFKGIDLSLPKNPPAKMILEKNKNVLVHRQPLPARTGEAPNARSCRVCKHRTDASSWTKHC